MNKIIPLLILCQFTFCSLKAQYIDEQTLKIEKIMQHKNYIAFDLGIVTSSGAFGNGYSLINEYVYYFRKLSKDKLGVGFASSLEYSALHNGSGTSCHIINTKLGLVIGYKVIDKLAVEGKVLTGIGVFYPSPTFITQLGYSDSDQGYLGSINFRTQIGVNARYAINRKTALIAGVFFNSTKNKFSLEATDSESIPTSYYSTSFSSDFSGKIHTTSFQFGIAINL